MRWLNSLSNSRSCPVCPETKNKTGQAESIAAVSLSSSSSLSSQKKEGGKPNGAFNHPLMKAGEGGYLVPDYAAWCPRWWKGCLECPDFMRDRVRFCRKWNLAFCGAEVVPE